LPIIIRRVSGDSMLPAWPPGKIIIARRRLGRLRPGQVIIIRHNGLEKLKRITAVSGDKLFVTGDNASASSDSRQFGWVTKELVLARTITLNPLRRLPTLKNITGSL
jgi:nickel-type superoxide dismutase maturation protease